LLLLACGLLAPDGGQIVRPGASYYCPQRTDSLPENALQFLSCVDRPAQEIRQKLGLSADFAAKWDTLSHGERKKLQIACALWARPMILALDEPFNHLDSDAKKTIINTLKDYDGIGLLVSHEKKILDELCNGCVFFYGNKIIIKPGAASRGLNDIKEENKSRIKLLRDKTKQHDKLYSEFNKRKDRALQADGRRSKSGLDIHDVDGRAKMDFARLTGKDAIAGGLQHQMEARLKRSEDEINSIEYVKEKKLGIWMPSGLSHRNYLFKSVPTKINMGAKTLNIPDLTISPADRISLTGNNGTGKSTLLNYIIPRLNVPPENICHIPQEIPEKYSIALWQNLRKSSNTELGRIMIIISSLGSDPKKLLESVTPSPGETRKLLLALGVMREPHIILMDEPTNHMDLPSIECLEQALKDCPCAMLLISHDESFLEKLTTIKWKITKTENDYKLNVD
jgi:ATPase subunit of ABC transporter with duplicated ATPase domains